VPSPLQLPAPSAGRWAQVTAIGVWAGLATLAGAVALLVLALADVGPDWFDRAGAVGVATATTVTLAVRTGGRPLVFGTLALALGVLAVVVDNNSLRAGAAVLTATGTAVLAVMATVPAVRFRGAVREVLVAVAISAVGALAVVGFRPVVSLERFDYTSLTLSFALGFVLVFQLGAGWHGLGRRGLVVVLVGSLALAVSLAYAEMLRRYGSPAVIDAMFDAVSWMRANLGAVPRPLQVLVGFPALVWGTHMRARRRQGWWVCVFGVAATVSVAGSLMNPATSLVEALLIVGYSLPPGLVIGYAAIRLDLLLTGPRGARARRAEERTALRPEPRRFQPLL
jgi:hypothetical protein